VRLHAPGYQLSTLIFVSRVCFRLDVAFPLSRETPGYCGCHAARMPSNSRHSSPKTLLSSVCRNLFGRRCEEFRNFKRKEPIPTLSRVWMRLPAWRDMHVSWTTPARVVRARAPGPTDGQVGYVCSCMPWRTAILRDTHIMHLDLQQSGLQGRREKKTFRLVSSDAGTCLVDTVRVMGSRCIKDERTTTSVLFSFCIQ